MEAKRGKPRLGATQANEVHRLGTVEHSTPRRSVDYIGALALLLTLCSSTASALHNQSWGRDKFSAAEYLRLALTRRPESDRTRHDYQRVIDAYRRVYLGCPTCAKADPSVLATAELLLQMGRQFDDDSIVRSAIKQFQFLRREYPGSKSRSRALFTIGEIYKDDLDEPGQARMAFQEFLGSYPNSRLTDDAEDALTELDQNAHEQGNRIPADLKSPSASLVNNTDGSDDEVARANTGKYTRVTGILHWTSSDAARVAIDLEQEIQFVSERLEKPSRIYFDLRDTRLAAGLAGKTFDVEGGLLKKIRVAQFERGRSRVVLEVAPQSEFRAYLLPNPNRLIIEIHGKKKVQPSGDPEQTDVAGSGQDRSAPHARMPLQGARTTSTEAPPAKNPPVLQASTEPRLPLVAQETKPIRTRIVEADDDDDDDRAETTKPAQSTRGRSGSLTAKKRIRGADSAASNPLPQRKRRSADGNDDEVATLNPLEMKPDEASPPSAPSFPKTDRYETKRGSKQVADLDVREAQPTRAGDRSLTRALGLKIGRIVIDPGHGGHDTGTIGPNGLEEKDVVLDVAKRLGKLLETRLAADVIFTRENDTFVPLETRTAIANQEQADLFVSIHANSSRDEDARGVETYYLNFTSNAAALEVAARENAASDKSIHELQDLVKKIALKEKIEESREFATDVQRSLHGGLALKNPGIRDRGVKKAPFVVLIGANMPSILAEISFVSNPTDERELDTSEYRQSIAESLYKGIAKYVSGLSGVRVASRLAKSDGQ